MTAEIEVEGLKGYEAWGFESHQVSFRETWTLRSLKNIICQNRTVWVMCKEGPWLVQNRELLDCLNVITTQTIHRRIRRRLVRCNMDQGLDIEQEGFRKSRILRLFARLSTLLRSREWAYAAEHIQKVLQRSQRFDKLLNDARPRFEYGVVIDRR